jgi:putative hydroxymethylpyrimidine transport system substrate-binding protein
MKMKKLLIAIYALALASFTLTAFAAGKQPEKLTVILDWYPNPDHAPLIIAKQQGYFKEENLDVELIGPADPNDPAKWVAAGKADIGITYQPEFIGHIDQGMPLIQIGTLIDKPLDCLVALKDSGIKQIQDLKGKRIGSTSGGMSTIILKTMLRHNGLTEKDIDLINVHYSLTQALLTRNVDAVSGMMRNFEIPLIESKNKKVIAFLPEEHGIPNYSELIFISNIKNVSDPRYPRFLNAIKKGVAWLDAHPEAAWKDFIKAYPEANNKVNRAAWFVTMPYFAEEPAVIDEKELLHFATFMRDNKMISKLQPTSRYAIILD